VEGSRGPPRNAAHVSERRVKEAVLLSCPEDDVENDQDREFWCECRGDSAKSYASLKKRNKAKKKAEEVRAAALELAERHNRDEGEAEGEAMTRDGDVSDVSAARPLAPRRYASVVAPFFKCVRGPLVCRGKGGCPSEKNMSFEFECLLPGGAELGTVRDFGEIKRGIHPTQPNTTTKRSGFLKKHYRSVYDEFVLGQSPFAKTVEVEGKLIQKMTLRDSWEAAVKYVIACASELRPVSFGKGPLMTDFLESLNPTFGVPCRSTCNRIAQALMLYDSENKCELLTELKMKRMVGFVATTEDSWTDGKGKNHFSSTTVHVVTSKREKVLVDSREASPEEIEAGKLTADAKEQLVLKDTQLVLSFRTSSSTDKANEIAEDYKAQLRAVGLGESNVSHSTLDGAAAGCASRRNLEGIEDWSVCMPHNVDRSVKHALGIGTSTSKNPAAKKLIQKNRRIAGFFHCSTARTRELIQSQNGAGVPKGKQLNAAVGSATRWSGDLATIKRNNILKDQIDLCLTAAMNKAGRNRPASDTRGDRGARSESMQDESDQEESDQYETDLSEDGHIETSAIRKSRVPEPMKHYEWEANAELEAALKMAEVLTLQTEGSPCCRHEPRFLGTGTQSPSKRHSQSAEASWRTACVRRPPLGRLLRSGPYLSRGIHGRAGATLRPTPSSTSSRDPHDAQPIYHDR